MANGDAVRSDDVTPIMREATIATTTAVLPRGRKCNRVFSERAATGDRARKSVKDWRRDSAGGPAQCRPASGLRNFDLDLEHFEIVLAL